MIILNSYTEGIIEIFKVSLQSNIYVIVSLQKYDKNKYIFTIVTV